MLPWDDLNHDPEWPPQSFRSWLNEKERNKPTRERQTLYIATVPEITQSVEFMNEWKRPNIRPDEPPAKKIKPEGPLKELVSPDISNFVKYLEAFYHGLPVRQFPKQLRFVPWKQKGSSKSKGSPRYIGLATGDRVTRIRVRPSRDGIFKAQLNLNDILDAAIEMLPDDAYSILLLVDHDIHEDEEDDFCCGRAYGGSRIAVVQTARYHPILDDKEKIDHEHMWPASHCKDFVNGLCAVEGLAPPKANKEEENGAAKPIRAAIAAASQVSPPSTTEELRALWFSRLCRTVVHELGHCLGMDHCVYYACNMQGTAGMAEDVRQPPYLCPVCLSKISYAISSELQGGNESEKTIYVKQRYEALIEFCRGWEDVGMFAGYAAWLQERLGSIAEK